jgi:hypothetical protein
MRIRSIMTFYDTTLAADLRWLAAPFSMIEASSPRFDRLKLEPGTAQGGRARRSCVGEQCRRSSGKATAVDIVRRGT